MDGGAFLLLFLLANVVALLGTGVFVVVAAAIERGRWGRPRRR